MQEGGFVKCWGLNNYGQLGYGDTQQRGDGANEMGASIPSRMIRIATCRGVRLELASTTKVVCTRQATRTATVLILPQGKDEFHRRLHAVMHRGALCGRRHPHALRRETWYRTTPSVPIKVVDSWGLMGL